ncbi:MAG: hypothetical protein LBL59_08550 [Xanthomonadaceae bacterium]|jgi:hypothetical protein|nr:hypothetical protein [Xanthomonadaceae bacterium]
MYWLFLLFAVGALALAFTTPHFWLMGLSSLAALALCLAWAYGWYSSRVGRNQRDESSMIDPVELRRMRELAEARKHAQSTQSGHSDPSSGPLS